MKEPEYWTLVQGLTAFATVMSWLIDDNSTAVGAYQAACTRKAYEGDCFVRVQNEPESIMELHWFSYN